MPRGDQDILRLDVAVVDIARVTVAQGAEKLKGQPLLLDIFKKRTCAVDGSARRKTPPGYVERHCSRTSSDRRESCRDIDGQGSRSCWSPALVGNQEHSAHLARAHVPLEIELVSSLFLHGPTLCLSTDDNLLTPYHFDVGAKVEGLIWLDGNLDDH